MLKVFAIFALAVYTLSAQTFEVASVRRSAPKTVSGARSTGGIPRQQDSTRINYPGVTLKSVVALAYGVAPDQVGGPQWLGDERYDIVATLPSGASQEQVPVMLRNLLTERFGIAVHEESKPRTGYALVAGKGEPKLKPAKESDGVGVPNSTMATFAAFLSSSMGRAVIDQTGIQGHYNITLNASMSDIGSGSVFGAIQDLGLKLETRSAPAKFVVVDKANKIPAGN